VIRPQFGGVPSGKVVVLDGKKALCAARLLPPDRPLQRQQ